MRKRLVAVGAALLSCPEVVVASTLIVFLSALLVVVSPAQAQTKSLIPVPRIQFLNTSGVPLANGHVHAYISLTTTEQATYTDSGGGTPNENPVVLDAGGFASIWLTPGESYTIKVDNSSNVQQYSIDGVTSGTLDTNLVVGTTAVTFSSTPTFDSSTSVYFSINLTGNVTSSTISNATDGRVIYFNICQDSTGGRTFTWDADVLNAPTIGSGVSVCTSVSYIYDGTNWRELAASSRGSSVFDTSTIGVLNSIRVVDGNKFTTVAAAVSDVSADGTVYIPDGTSETLTVVLTINKPLTLWLGRNVTLNCGMTDPGTGTGCIDITSSNVTIQGMGDTSVLTQPNAQDIQTMIHIHANDNIRFSGFKLDGNNVNQTNASGFFTGIRSSNGAEDVEVDHMLFTRAGNRAVDFRAIANINIHHNRFIDTGYANGTGGPTGSGGNAVSVDVDGAVNSTDVDVSHNYFELFGDTAIGVPSSARVTISDNIIRCAADVGETGMSTESGISANGVEDGTVKGNTVRKCKAAGIDFNDKTQGGVHYPVKRLEIIGNSLLSGTGLSTILRGSASSNTNGSSRGLVVSENTVNLADDVTATADAIAIGGTFWEGSVFSGNVLLVDTRTAGQIGISVGGGDEYSFTGNTTVNFDRGVEFLSASGCSGIVSGNHFFNTGSTGLGVNTQASCGAPLIGINFNEDNVRLADYQFLVLGNTNPSLAGDVRFRGGARVLLAHRNNANNANRNIVRISTGDTIFWGNSTGANSWENGVDFQVGHTIGGGTNITKHRSGTASLDFTALAANSCEVLTIAVTDAADGDTVTLGVPDALADVDGGTERTTFFGWVSAA